MQHSMETLISHPTPFKSYDGLDMNRSQSTWQKVRVIRSFQMLELLEKALPFKLSLQFSLEWLNMAGLSGGI